HDPAIRGGGVEAVLLPDPRQDRDCQFLLAIAGPAVRRHRGTWRVGEVGARGGAAGSTEEAIESAKVREDCRCHDEKGRTRKGCGPQDDRKKEASEAKEALAGRQATWLWRCTSAVYPGSTSQITR